MIKNIITIALTLASFSVFAQAKKPRIMVMPTKAWCIENGYYTEFNDEGTVKQIPDYEKAIMDKNMSAVITKLGQLMTDENYDLERLDAVLESFNDSEILEKNTSSEDNDDIAIDAEDHILQTSKTDIVMRVEWSKTYIGPKCSILYTLYGIDSYTNKQVATCSGASDAQYANSMNLPATLISSARTNMPAFVAQLGNHMRNMLENGREVTLECKRWANSEYNYLTEFEDEELNYWIKEWVKANTVKHSFSTKTSTANRILFNQVRIPMYDEDGAGVDTESWARDLQRMLRRRFGIPSRIQVVGLGQAILIIGSK